MIKKVQVRRFCDTIEVQVFDENNCFLGVSVYTSIHREYIVQDLINRLNVEVI